MLKIDELRLPVGHTEPELYQKVSKILRRKDPSGFTLKILRRSLDARKKPQLFYNYALTVELPGEEEGKILQKKIPGVGLYTETVYRFPCPDRIDRNDRPVIIGFGPAGIFAGLMLSGAGLRPIILERGSAMEERDRDVEEFFRKGILKPESNVQFGEGGAGAYSDGKLNTLTKDREGIHRFVLNTFVEFGAPEEILYDQKPHIGTDRLKSVISAMRKEIIRLGGEVRFHSTVTDFEISEGKLLGLRVNDGERIPCTEAILATGHSARDTVKTLFDRGVSMEPKAFAVGVRMEHPAELINRIQYGEGHETDLGAASYKLTHHCASGRGVYTFCMCPGGYIVNASSEQGRTVVNGMSNHGRDGEKSNAALVVTVTPEDFDDPGYALSGIDLQRKLEEASYRAGNSRIPAETYGEYRKGVLSLSDEEFKALRPAILGQYCHADLGGILPLPLKEDLIEGMEAFGRKMPGFNDDRVILAGVESRTSSPVRIIRDEDYHSNISGLYPCGEGAGYAGGIMSAATDGIRVAQALCLNREIIHG